MSTTEYRAIFSYPPTYGFDDGPPKSPPDRYSEPVDDPAKLPTHVPRSEETLGWVSGVQSREVGEWATVPAPDERDTRT